MTLAAPIESLAAYAFGDNKQEIELGSVGQEQFCRLVAMGHDYEKAYRRAYSIAATRDCIMEAHRMARAPHIVARIMQIRRQGIAGYVVQREDLLEPLLWAINTARERGSTAEVRKSIEAVGKLFGLIIDKIENETLHKFQVMKDVSIDGSELVFDIGSGQSLSIRGDKVQADAIEADSGDAERVADGGGATTLLGTLQNTTTALPIDGVMLNDVDVVKGKPQDVVGARVATPHVASRGSRVRVAQNAKREPGGGGVIRKVGRRADVEAREAARLEAMAEERDLCGEEML